MGYFDGKQGLILGVANDRSIAWAIAKEIMDQGGVCGFTHLPDKPEDEKKKEPPPHIMILSSGDLTSFDLQFEREGGDERWHVFLQPDDQVTAERMLETS